jgi:predicted nucleotidyltransferase
LSKNNISLTPYDDVNVFLQILLDNVRATLGNCFIGMYLYGSLALGEFDANRSDIDFLVVTSEKLSLSKISDLKNMHTRIYESGLEWATKLEGAFIPLKAIRAYSPTGPACPLVNKKEFLVARPESNWVINRHVLYTSGVVVTGPPLVNIINPVQPKQLHKAVLTLLRDNWTPWLENSDLFLGVGYQAFVVLTMCRALYTLKNGTVAPKIRSAEWVIAYSKRKWTKLIKQAMAWHYEDPPGDIRQTQEFMRYVLEEAGLQNNNQTLVTKPSRNKVKISTSIN